MVEYQRQPEIQFKMHSKICVAIKNSLNYLFNFFSYPTALELVSKGVVDVKPLISHRFSLPDSVKAFETASSYDSKAVKVIIDCDQN